jgi:hypothetical protein
VAITENACNAIGLFLPRFLSAWGKADVTFDVWIANAVAGGSAMLIEVNPWGAPTDPCLFSWQDRDFDGSFRIRTEIDIQKHGFGKL